MKSKFSHNIKPFVEYEVALAKQRQEEGNMKAAFKHLENAHVLGQESTYYHVKVHFNMLFWGMKMYSVKEITGQIVRLMGAATKTVFKLVPKGNTGGSNVSPFKRMPLSDDHKRIIAEAKNQL